MANNRWKELRKCSGPPPGPTWQAQFHQWGHFFILPTWSTRWSAAMGEAFASLVSMVFGHALVILPAVVRIRLRYSPILYLPLALLHASVAFRVGGGLAGWDFMRKGSGIVTVLSLIAFVGSLALARWRDGSAQHPVPNPMPGVDQAA